MCCLNTFCHQFCNLLSASISLYASVKLVKHAFMRLNCILSHSRWFMPSPSWNLLHALHRFYYAHTQTGKFITFICAPFLPIPNFLVTGCLPLFFVCLEIHGVHIIEEDMCHSCRCTAQNSV